MKSGNILIFTAKLLLIMLFLEMAPAGVLSFGPDEAYASQFMCGKDLLGDNYEGDYGDTTQCVGDNTQHWVCSYVVDSGFQGNPGFQTEDASCKISFDDCTDNGCGQWVDLLPGQKGWVGDGIGVGGWVTNTSSQTSGSGGNYVCPIGATNCVPTYNAPTCPAGGTYELSSQQCVAPVTNTYQCSYNGAIYGDSGTCSANCYQSAACTANYHGQFQCSYNGGVYGDAGTCSANCYAWSGCASYQYWVCNYADNDGGVPSFWGDCYALFCDNNYCGVLYPGQSYGYCVDDVCSYTLWWANTSYVASAYYCPFNGAACSGGCAQYYGCYDESYYTYTCPFNGAACSGSCSQYYGCNTLNNCPSGYSYSGGRCVAPPSCASGTFQTSNGQCFIGNTTCPLGNYQCVPNNGVNQCSSLPCVDISVAGNHTYQNADSSMHINDGAKDSNGNCLGQIYIFEGSADTCEDSGADDGFTNCCKNTKGALTDSVSGTAGNGMTAIGTIKAVYEATGTVTDAISSYNAVSEAQGMVAANPALHLSVHEAVSGGYTVGVANSAGQITNVTGTGLTEAGLDAAAPGFASNGVIDSSNIVNSASDAATNGIMGAVDPYAVAGLLAKTLLPGMAGDLLSIGMACIGGFPVGCIASIVSEVFSFLMAGCTQMDIHTSQLAASGMCHHVGSECTDKWFLIGCVQKSEVYCCFNSKLGRIIQEQGRPQLQSFVAEGIWGDSKSPDCRGFTPQEFSSLDFSKIDLSEYLSDIEKNMTVNIENAQSNAASQISNFYQATQNPPAK